MAMPWFDAHLDLAYLAVSKRAMTKPLDPGMLPHAPAAVTLSALHEGSVQLALATIFTEPVNPGAIPAGGLPEPQMYAAGDAARAHAEGRAQLEVYMTWRDQGHVRIGLMEGVAHDEDVGEVRGGMGVAEFVRRPVLRVDDAAGGTVAVPLHLGILMENADPIRTPDELRWWQERGVVAIGLAWARASRYAGGNTTDLGVSQLGRELVREMDRLGVRHDVSHLSDRALDDLLSLSSAPVMASHSNVRALLAPRGECATSAAGTGEYSMQRHLRDETIREIGRRGGVVGLNLFSKFLTPPERAGARATIDDCVRHVEHICEQMGHRRGVGLGSDMDGGFSAAQLPVGIERPADLPRLTEALADRGWNDEEIAGFCWANWVRFWSRARGVVRERRGG